MPGKNLLSTTSTAHSTIRELNPKLDRHLMAYATAAGAAGVAILAFAQPSHAEIVYTPADIRIVQDGPLVPLDLTNDGTADFSFFNFATQSIGSTTARGGLDFENELQVRVALASNRVVAAESKGHLCAAALPYGTKVGPSSPFQPGASILLMAFSDQVVEHHERFCPWLGSHRDYLGLKFSISGETHFGWARLRVNGFSRVVITGYAYESVANTPIITGKTSGTNEVSGLEGTAGTLGALAQGSVRNRQP
jgi:hypothetical protein